MKRMLTKDLVPGMIIAKKVKTYDNSWSVPKGTQLTDKLITKLVLYGVQIVHIEDGMQTLVMEEDYSDDVLSYYERLKRSPEFKKFRKTYETGVTEFHNSINDIVERNMSCDIDSIIEKSLDLIEGLRGQVGILAMLQNMREYDNSTYAHSINVALISNLLATWLKMSEEDIKLATVCGLLHDIGKIQIPHSIITKPGDLSKDEFHQVKKHPQAGYNLLKQHDINEHIKNTALMHHERLDGSGYPSQLKGAEIDRFAKLIAISDVYDAMTAARVYRGPVPPFRVIEIFESEGLQKYDAQYLLVFLENVVNTYIRTRCHLSNGQQGDIVFINKAKLSRPVIQCDNEYIDLAARPELEIVSLI